MTDLKKLADEYASAAADAELADANNGATLSDAYLAGARAAIEASAAKVKADAGIIMQNYVLTGPAGIIGGCVQAIRSLLPEVST